MGNSQVFVLKQLLANWEFQFFCIKIGNNDNNNNNFKKAQPQP